MSLRVPIRIVAIGLLLGLLATPPALAAPAPVVDMAGRKVALPAAIERVVSIHSIPSHMLWRLAPARMVNIDLQFKDRLLLIPPAEARRLRALPLTGIYRRGIHREDILGLRPDLILSMSKDPKLDREQRDFGAPVLAISKDRLADYAEAWRLLGRVLGNPTDGQLIGDYWDDTLRRVAAVIDPIPATRRPKVYYAQRAVTSTVGAATIMASIIRLAGGVSLLDGMDGPLLQKQSESIPVSLEDVIAWDPEVIIAASAAARDEILTDARWQSVRAVRDRRVHAVTLLAMPDRIQSLLGLVWMANTLHPEVARFDLLAEARRFYGLVSRNDAVTAEMLRQTR